MENKATIPTHAAFTAGAGFSKNKENTKFNPRPAQTGVETKRSLRGVKSTTVNGKTVNTSLPRRQSKP